MDFKTLVQWSTILTSMIVVSPFFYIFFPSESDFLIIFLGQTHLQVEELFNYSWLLYVSNPDDIITNNDDVMV